MDLREFILRGVSFVFVLANVSSFSIGGIFGKDKLQNMPLFLKKRCTSTGYFIGERSLYRERKRYKFRLKGGVILLKQNTPESFFELTPEPISVSVLLNTGTKKEGIFRPSLQASLITSIEVPKDFSSESTESLLTDTQPNFYRRPNLLKKLVPKQNHSKSLNRSSGFMYPIQKKKHRLKIYLDLVLHQSITKVQRKTGGKCKNKKKNPFFLRLEILPVFPTRKYQFIPNTTLYFCMRERTKLITIIV